MPIARSSVRRLTVYSSSRCLSRPRPSSRPPPRASAGRIRPAAAYSGLLPPPPPTVQPRPGSRLLPRRRSSCFVHPSSPLLPCQSDCVPAPRGLV
ncbi:hypothetical protein BS78_01G236200 [Paspalum vaginatum]|nr:hypothetical protein BS78_01G236200 [Paspalum vaginatum]